MKHARAALAVVVAAAAVLGSWTLLARRSSAAQTPLDRELAQLRSSNGLYFHPSLLAAHQVSIPDTAYDLLVLKMAGEHPSAPWGDAAALGEARDVLAQQSAWGSWYLAQIESVSGVSSPVSYRQRDAASYQADGYLANLPDAPTDAASRLASTAAGLEALGDAGVRTLTADQRKRIAGWLDGAAASPPNAYQAYNAERALAALGQAVPGSVAAAFDAWWTAKGSTLPTVSSLPDLLDLYGYACGTQGKLDPAREQHLQSLISPLLSQPAEADIRFYAASVWTCLGGAKSGLAPLAAIIEAQLPSGGAAPAVVTKLGTLDNTYYVAEIRQLAGEKVSDPALASTVRQALAQPGIAQNSISLLEAATILTDVDASDPGLDQRARQAADAQIPAQVTLANVGAWDQGRTMLDRLGLTSPASAAAAWDVSTPEGTNGAWMLLAHASSVKGPLSAALEQSVPSIGAQLADPGNRFGLAEVRAGIQAALAANVPAADLRAAARTRLHELRGCQGFPDLYRPTPDATVCDLRATMDAYWIQNTLAIANP